MTIFFRFLFLWSILVFNSELIAASIVGAHVDVAKQSIVLQLSYGDTADSERKNFIKIDAGDCVSATAPVVTCKILVKDELRRYRFGEPKIHPHEFNLRDFALNIPSYSKTQLNIVADDQSNVSVDLPKFSVSDEFRHTRLRLIETQYPGDDKEYYGFHHLIKHNLFDKYLIGISTCFSEPKPTDYVVAHDIETKKITWRAKLDSGNFLNYAVASPTDPYVVIGGRFQRTQGAKSNLQLIDARTGKFIREFQGVESLDMTSSYWVKNQILISHASMTDRTVGDDIIVDRGFVRGIITWHDLQTGELLKSIDSPLLEARAIEQSSDEKHVVFAGFEGAAIVDVMTGNKMFMIHMSDIYGPEYARCNNFGCGTNRAGFGSVDVSADRRLIALAGGSEIIIVDTQTKKIMHRFKIQTPDRSRLFIRTIKMDPVTSKIYVFAGEKFDGPAIAHVMVYSLTSGKLIQWHQGINMPGESGGNDNSTIFSNDFKYLFSADSADGISDSRMMRHAAYRAYYLE